MQPYLALSLYYLGLSYTRLHHDLFLIAELEMRENDDVLLHNSIHYSINWQGWFQEKETLHFKQVGSFSGNANMSCG